MELTIYLAEKIIQHAVRHGKRSVIAWGCDCRATHKDVTQLQSNQQANTKILLHVLDATADAATEIQTRETVFRDRETVSRTVSEYVNCHRKRPEPPSD